MGMIWVLTWNNHLSTQGVILVHHQMEVKLVNNLKKGAIICAVVMMISIVPAFALNDTSNNTTTDQTTDQTTAQNSMVRKMRLVTVTAEPVMDLVTEPVMGTSTNINTARKTVKLDQETVTRPTSTSTVRKTVKPELKTVTVQTVKKRPKLKG